jgi:alpha-2-macroglobulin
VHELAFTTTRRTFDPGLTAPSGLFVLDPRFAIPQWIVDAEAVSSVHVELYQVTPADYFAYEDYEAGTRRAPPGKRIVDKLVDVGARYSVRARVDLRPALAATQTGHVVAVATIPGHANDGFQPRVSAWIEVTKLAVSARLDGEKATAWVQDMTASHLLAPVSGAMASVMVVDRGVVVPPVATDGEGRATFALADPVAHSAHDREHSALLVATSGDDSAFAAVSRYEKTIRNHLARWYVTDDRFTYKPGEKVYVKGWVRWTDDGVNPDLSLPANGDAVAYTLVDARGNQIARGNADLDAHGGFDLVAELPATANLGTAWFEFRTRGASDRLPISIEEFRTPAYAVTLNDDVSHGGAAPLVAGESIEMLAEARYYAGGGLAGAGIDWSAKLEPASYEPAGWDDYTFEPVPLRSKRSVRRESGVTDERTAELSGASTSNIVFGVPAVPSGRPAVLSVDATVTDVDRQTIRASSRSILVHPSSYYVGLRVAPGDTNQVLAIVTDIDGNAVPGVAIDLAIDGVLGSERYRADASVIDSNSCKLTSAATAVACPWHRKDDQTVYTAVARIADARGRVNTAELAIPWWSIDATQLGLDLVPNKAMYRPGDVAKIEIRSNTVPATAIVSIARNGMVSQQRVELKETSTTFELPIDAAYISDVHVVVDRFAAEKSKTKASALPLPRHVTAEIDLPVDVEAARLTVTARPTKPVVAPGDDATFEVHVTHGDQPVAGAEVALIVVDEAVLALSGRSHAHPLAPFYTKLDAGTWESSSLALVDDARETLAGDPGVERTKLDEMIRGGRRGFGSGYGAGGGGFGTVGAGSSLGFVRARKDMRATAAFSPRLTTDESGHVTLTVKMPDSLTRFRVVALASYESHYFGKGEGTIITQRPINARTVAPRFLSQGDSFSLPVVVQNLDSVTRVVDVAVRAANLVQSGPAGKRISVPPGARAEVRFDMATRARGRAAIQTIAVSGALADASAVQLQVYEPATTESFATYGSVSDAPKFERLDVPSDIFPEVGGVETELASTQLQSLTDAYWYLYAYPFECAEQRSSRMLATTAVADILDAFGELGTSKSQIQRTLDDDVAKLSRDQNVDGGWGYFEGMPSDPYVTAQVLSALSAAHRLGSVTERASKYVQRLADALLAKLERATNTPVRRGRDEEPYDVSLASAALSSLARAGNNVQTSAMRLHAAATAVAAYPMDAKARVLALLAKRPFAQVVRRKLVADILSAAHETAAGATIAASYVEAERLVLPSTAKTDALALDALIREVPEHPLVEKLARGLLGARKRGRWATTQENIAVLQAMRRYFDTYEKETPSFTGKLWFGTTAYAEQTFAGRSSVRATMHLDWAQLPPGSSHEIALQDAGTGRMYYRIGVTYAPRQIDLPALDAGFVVRRSYEAADRPDDVVHAADGTWHIKLGARVRVVLETVTTTGRDGVALVDPLPAGLEPVNTRLAIAERAARGSDAGDWDHIEMRDNRSEAFAMSLAAGSHRFVYTARATTPGKFIAAPAHAEEMYAPETFGRSAGTTVTIE